MTDTVSGLAEMATALVEGRVNAQELTERSLARIAAAQPSLNAFRIVRAEAALAEAEAADRRLARGERLPLLAWPGALRAPAAVAGGAAGGGGGLGGALATGGRPIGTGRSGWNLTAVDTCLTTRIPDAPKLTAT
ncbi:hypothetical protein BX286_6207 [Streptomyces sp. 3211.6]|uniref:amidase family protein n=1 Tax=Streptomyces sp. 3211.6 TaxID=1938845 RepID=UPI000F21DBA9|nr:hypothetical protein BX286_6207 [Streptomyces sp. 3211.6]